MSSNLLLTPSRYLGKKNRPISDGRIIRLRNERSKRFNPFEVDLEKRIRDLTWSPTVLSCPEKTPPQCSWNIDQLSKLNPIDIESSPSSHQETESLSPETENRLQEDIRAFFNNFKLPSPSDAGGHFPAHRLPGDDQCSNVSISSRRSLELSFNQSLEVSMMSEVSEAEERRVHGGFIKSPNADVISCADVHMDTPTGRRMSGLNSSFNESEIEI